MDKSLRRRAQTLRTADLVRDRWLARPALAFVRVLFGAYVCRLALARNWRDAGQVSADLVNAPGIHNAQQNLTHMRGPGVSVKLRADIGGNRSYLLLESIYLASRPAFRNRAPALLLRHADLLGKVRYFLLKYGRLGRSRSQLAQVVNCRPQQSRPHPAQVARP